MAWKQEKSTGDYIWSGVEQGIGSSPTKGVANIQNANISTELGEVMCSYARVMQTATPVGTNAGTLSVQNGSTLIATPVIPAGTWITIGSGITGLSSGNYYVVSSNPTNGNIRISSTFSFGSNIVTGMSGGPALFSTYVDMGQAVQSAVEPYNISGTQQYRYYILDINGFVWVHDTNDGAFSIQNPDWYIPYPFNLVGSNPGTITNASGIAVLNGNLLAFQGNRIYGKPTVKLDDAWGNFVGGNMMSTPTSPNIHRAFVGHQGKCYYTDGQFIGSIFPNTSLLTGAANIQSYAKYTTTGAGGGVTGTLGDLYSGVYPSAAPSSARIPATFFASTGGTVATAMGGTNVSNAIYYIQNTSLSAQTFSVYAAISGGSALDINTGTTGTQYFNTFWPLSAFAETTYTFTPQRLNLPYFETSQCIAELGDLVIIGGRGNVLYPWNQVDPLPSDLIPLPENNTVNMITVNNMVYAFSGYKANIYITNGSTASLAVSIPDYCAGVPGTPTSYIEPYFSWGGAMYLRGRVYFSILDQTSTKAGNCGGIWSFVPTQNFFIGQDTGISLRQEAQSSYDTYNGVTQVLIPNQVQFANGPQYWSAWQNSYDIAHTTVFAIDGSSSAPSATSVAVIETDALETGTILSKETFTNLEYKLSAPLAVGESVAIKYRTNLTDAWVTMGTLDTENSQALSGYYAQVPFEQTQWIQFQIILTPTASNPSFVRLKELRLR